MKYPRLAGSVPLRHASSQAPPLRFGTGHVVDLIAASPDARWTAFAQPVADTDGDGVIATSSGPHGSRFGDRMQPFLAWDDGTTEPIDDFIDGSRDGRFIAIVRGRALRVMDTLTRQESTLDGARTLLYRHRSDAFDAEGTHFVWVRSSPEGDRVVVRSLDTGRDHAFAPLQKTLRRASIDESGSWVLARVGDAFGVWAAPVDGCEMRARPGFVTVVGRFLMQRRSDGALIATTPDEASAVWAPADCQGEVIARSPSMERLLVVCRTTRAVSLHGPATHCALPLRGTLPRDEPTTVQNVTFVTGVDETSHRVDLDAARVDVESFGGAPPPLPTIWLSTTTEHSAISNGVWVDFVGGTYALVHDTRALAVDVYGRMLLAVGDDAVDGWGMRRGPLVWRRPVFTPLRFGWTSGMVP